MKQHLRVALCCALLFFSFLSVYGQTITGTVFDASSSLPLAFANVKTDTGQETATDINGHFSIPATRPVGWIRCSYIGYKTRKTNLEPNQTAVTIRLIPDEQTLQEVVVTHVNPAIAIMAKVIANKPRNNPENLKSYAYNCYNKVMLNVRSQDTTVIKVFRDKHAFLMESVTHRKFLAPDLSEETVRATRVSGFQDPGFAAVMTDFQPFSFYKDNIKLLDRNYLNPIAQGSLSKYRFRLEETRLLGKDTVYVISFSPKSGKNFDALKGQLFINTDGYAVQNVVASPAERKKVELHIAQEYQRTAGQWFPSQMGFSLVFNEYPDKKMSMAMEGKSYLDSIQVNPALRRRDFGVESVVLRPDMAQKDSVYWDRFRRESLNAVDRKTYQLLDSVGKAHHTDKLLRGIVSLATGRLPIGKVDLDVNRLFSYNKYEGLRLGAGLYTNKKLFGDLTLGGYYGYGFRDHISKYGGEIYYDFWKKQEWQVGVKYYNDLSETGIPNMDGRSKWSNYRQVLGSQYDQKEGFAAWTSFRSLRWLKWRFGLASEAVTPKYDYAFGVPANPINDYHHTALNVNLRFAYRERLSTAFDRRNSLGSDYPVLQVSYTRGFRNWLDGDFAYHKIEAQASHSFFTRNLGTTSWLLQAGRVDRPVPYGLNFTGEGSYDKDIPVIMKNTFQTMLPYEFLSDRYANVFLSHDFGGLLFRAGKFQPGISMHTNLGIGNLCQPALHQGLDFKVKDKLFCESGLQFDSLLKLNYFGIADAGFGVAAYYRYGYYAHPDSGDNWVLKMTFRLTLK